MTRTERFVNVLKMTRRIHELCDLYGWSESELSKAVGLMDEPAPLGLHYMGMSELVQAAPEIQFLFLSLPACHIFTSDTRVSR